MSKKLTELPNLEELSESDELYAVKDGLDYRVSKIASRKYVDDKASLYMGTNNSIWEPSAEPAASNYCSPTEDDANDFLTKIWEPLRNSATSYITRSVLGTDESGTYDIHKYVFTPPNYEKTIVINCSMHGLEVMNQIATYRFFYNVVNNWSSSQHLTFARWKIRWVVVPMLNPWGVSQSTRTRTNSNDVDIARNFDFRWEEYDDGVDPLNYKGTSAFSEAESRILRDLVEIDYPHAHALIDSHDYGQNNPDAEFYRLYMTTQDNVSNKLDIIGIIENLKKEDYHTSSIRDTRYPSAINYFTSTNRCLAFSPEWNFAVPDSSRYDNEGMTAALRWYSNLYLCTAWSESIQKIKATGHFFKRLSFPANNSDFIPHTVDTYDDVIPEFKFTPSCPGTLLVNTNLSLTTDTASQVAFRTYIDQFSYLSSTGQEGITPYAYIHLSPGQISAASSFCGVHMSQDKEVTVRLEARKSAGTIECVRGGIFLTFLPTNNRQIDLLSVSDGEWSSNFY